MQENGWNPTNENLNQLPKLYSKNAIWFFSIFFSLLAGTLLMRANLKQLGEHKKANQVLLFGVAFLFIQGFCTYFLTSITSNSQAIALGLTFVGTALMYYLFWEKTIPSNTEYERKSTFVPMMICLIIIIPLLMLLQQQQL